MCRFQFLPKVFMLFYYFCNGEILSQSSIQSQYSIFQISLPDPALQPFCCFLCRNSLFLINGIGEYILLPQDQVYPVRIPFQGHLDAVCFLFLHPVELQIDTGVIFLSHRLTVIQSLLCCSVLPDLCQSMLSIVAAHRIIRVTFLVTLFFLILFSSLSFRLFCRSILDTDGRGKMLQVLNFFLSVLLRNL